LPDSNRSGFNPAFATVTTLFFMWGFVTASIDPLVPSVRAVFSLGYTESMLTQFAFFLAYGVISLPAAFVLEPASFAAKGGTLDYTLAKAPGKNWGSGSMDAPPSFGP
jgi:fucose permease